MTDKNQAVSKAKGRPLLQWVGKKPLERVEYFPAQEKEVYGDKSSKTFNKLFWGDNLQVHSHLLKEYRGKVDLIYIDPPFDSKAEYVKRVKLRGIQLEGQPQSLLEEKQYSDIWENDEYLQFMYERVIILRELLSDAGSIYLHCDPTRGHYLKMIMDEVFGSENFINQIIWKRTFSHGDIGQGAKHFGRLHDMILLYSKTSKYNMNTLFTEYTEKYKSDFYKYTDARGRKYRLVSLLGPGGAAKGNPYYEFMGISRYWVHSKVKMEQLLKEGKIVQLKPGTVPQKKRYIDESPGVPLQDIWTDISAVQGGSLEQEGYPTQKPEALLERIIKASTNAGDLVLDSFCGSGTTMAVAQRLGRNWIGCDINIGAIQTSTKRIATIINNQLDGKDKLLKSDRKGTFAFKVYNVNEYDIFKNELEAKEIIMDMYSVTPIKRSYFDGTLDNNFVKVMPLNRVLNKLDIKTVVKSIEDSIGTFSVKKTSKATDATYEQGVLIICSGAELDATDYLKKENKTGVRVEVRDILNDKKNLIFKQKPEAKIAVSLKNGTLKVGLQEFYSPILMRRLELENEATIDQKSKVKVSDYKQIIDSVAIDVDYDGKLFNAEIIDLPTKKELIKAHYVYEKNITGKTTVAVKIVDVLGEEYFETFSV